MPNVRDEMRCTIGETDGLIWEFCDREAMEIALTGGAARQQDFLGESIA